MPQKIEVPAETLRQVTVDAAQQGHVLLRDAATRAQRGSVHANYPIHFHQPRTHAIQGQIDAFSLTLADAPESRRLGERDVLFPSFMEFFCRGRIEKAEQE